MIGIHMTKLALLFAICLVMLITATVIHAQGFTGPGSPLPPPGGPGYGPPPPPHGGPGFGPPPPPGGPGFGPPPHHGGPGFDPPPSGFQGQYGFTGPAQTVTVEQAKTFAHRTPVIVSGTIVQAIGGDMFQFRDSSGEIVLKIGPREWMYYGAAISPQDTIEISGEVCYGTGWEPVHVHARYIRKL
ncbi:MAG: NirD/YgiW/YdeI family stress tolerance protein [Treponema sp.]|jgi:uncharacterized protein (TIGR00156 family)|nr:NirD/YgiW/YdeI family stress tolerance protein [Treponema sp.]